MTAVLTTADPFLRARSTRLNDGDTIDVITKNSGRSPVARFVGNGDIPHPPAPAWYVPGTADIYIHVDRAGIDVSKFAAIRIFHDAGFDAAKTVGLLCHEAAHAAISDGMTEVQKRAPHHGHLLTLFEEIRVENHALRRLPASRRHLRASFTIVLKGVAGVDLTNTSAVAHAWALIRGRTLAGIATPAETEALDMAARTLLGDDKVDELTDLLQEAVTLRLPEDADRMIAICDEWLALVGRDDTDEGCEGGPDGSGAKGTEGEGQAIEGGGGGATGEEGEKEEEGAGAGAGKADDEANKDGSDAAHNPGLGEADSTPAIDHGDDEPEAISEEGTELVAQIIKDLGEDLAEAWADPDESALRANPVEWASRIFGNRRHYTSLEYREPTTKQRQDVVKVANVLGNLSLPAVAKVTQARVVPPGRLRSREAVRGSAERMQGQMVTAKPWRGTARRHSVARPLVLGIATDTSGSMYWAAEAVAEFAYVYANAGHRIGARTAAVTFGSSVRRIARPGEVMTNVVFKPASDSEEQCDYALAALDGVLHLTTPSSSARILMVVSDGALVRHEETSKVTSWLTKMNEVGTHVLWITDHDPGPHFWVPRLAKKLGNMTQIAIRDSATRGGTMDFDRLNEAALEAITKYIR